MAVILQVDFPYSGPFGDDMTSAMQELAQSINGEPGFIWKIWTENAPQKCAGGIYLFDNESNAQAYLDKHSQRLKAIGIEAVRGHIFAINSPLSRLNRAPDNALSV